GRIGDTIFLGLPGNPISTMVTFELFVRPVLWRLFGREKLNRPRVKVELNDPVMHAPGRREFVRSQCWLEGGRFFARPTGAQGSGILTSMLGANALLVLPEDSSGYAKGESAEAILIGPPLDGRPA